MTQVVDNCVAWARKQESHCLTFSAVHMVMEAHDKPDYRAKLNTLDMVNPDGMPVVWALRLLGWKSATRVYGPDATVCLLKAAAKEGIPVGFYGGSEATVNRLVEQVNQQVSGHSDRLRLFAAVSQAYPGRRRRHRKRDQRLRRALHLCRPGVPEAGRVDDRSP